MLSGLSRPPRGRLVGRERPKEGKSTIGVLLGTGRGCTIGSLRWKGEAASEAAMLRRKASAS